MTNRAKSCAKRPRKWAQIRSQSLRRFAQQGQGLLLIDYELDGKKLRNHYVYGKPPFALAQAKKWVEQIGVERD